MLNFFSLFKRAERREIRDAQIVYSKIMQQSRKPVFYGAGLAPDSYDGRMEVLCMHLGLLLHALRGHGEMGARLGQAVYDVMIADFDVALREEGLSDTGVKRRMKPLAKMFFIRAEDYAGALDGKTNMSEVLEKRILNTAGGVEAPIFDLKNYARAFAQTLQNCTLGDIAQGNFQFPNAE